MDSGQKDCRFRTADGSSVLWVEEDSRQEVVGQIFYLLRDRGKPEERHQTRLQRQLVG